MELYKELTWPGVLAVIAVYVIINAPIILYLMYGPNDEERARRKELKKKRKEERKASNAGK